MDCKDTKAPKLLKRVPVYVNSNPKENLILLQFPGKGADTNLDFGSLRYKPLFRQVELDVNLDKRCNFYDAEKAEALVNSSGATPRGESGAMTSNSNQSGGGEDETHSLDKMVYGSNALSKHASYMVAVLRNGALHMTPLSYALQLRAQLKYLDSSQSRGQQSGVEGTQQGPNGSLASAKEGANGNRAVQVKVRSKSDLGKDEYMRSERELVEQVLEKDSWLEYSVEKQPVDSLDILFPSLQSAEVRSNVYSCMNRDEYHLTLLPDKAEKDLASVSQRLHQDLPLYEIVQLPVFMRIPAFLVNCHVATSSELVKYLQLHFQSSGELIQTMQEFAVPIRDRWVVKSRFLYDPKMALARDYLLALFSEHELVHRDYYSKDISLPFEQLKNMIAEIAQRVDLDKIREAGKSSFAWQLKGEPDVSFRDGLSHEEAVLLRRLENELLQSRDAIRKKFENFGQALNSSSRRHSVSRKASLK